MVGVAIGEEMVTVGDVLSAAADRIEKYGLQKEGFGHPNGPVCAWGGINMALVGHPADYAEQGMDVRDNLAVFVDATEGIPHWNDTIAKSKRQVVRTLRLAAWVYDDTLLTRPVVRRG